MLDEPEQKELDTAEFVAAAARGAQEKLEGLDAATQVIARAYQDRLEELNGALTRASDIGRTVSEQSRLAYQPLTDALDLWSRETLLRAQTSVDALPRVGDEIGWVLPPPATEGAETAVRVQALAESMMDDLGLAADERVQVAALVDMAHAIDGLWAGHGTVQTVISYVVARQLDSQERSDRRWRYVTLGVALFSLLVTATIGILACLVAVFVAVWLSG